MIHLEKKEEKAVGGLVQKYSIELLLIYGSRVSGKIHKESDYDFAYLSKRPLSIQEEGELMIKLASMLKIPLLKLELVPLKKISPLFFKEIFSNAQVIYDKDGSTFDRYQIYAFRIFEESQGIFENMKRILFKKTERYKKELSVKK